MRPSNRRAAAGALALFAVAALAAPAVAERPSGPGRGHGGEAAPKVALFGSTCRTSVRGSRVVAYCHNPYPVSDIVRLHTECDRWWDIDADGSPVEVGPAQTVRLTDRCWKEVRRAWVSHHRM
ncbi:hypothetical protein AR457_26850 [Streptomyces agglomeratus]|uniref:hypothetical protein n=1 Tax=Streptomyces agglomeratus TaxID=285458 RepID=UPI000854024E|nr:hypothetical protein [Streptomyces agglomeratus]OEJ49238.1 hypothetical protein AR457_26850 [Streptomyces agglomeratus]